MAFGKMVGVTTTLVRIVGKHLPSFLLRICIMVRAMGFARPRAIKPRLLVPWGVLALRNYSYLASNTLIWPASFHLQFCTLDFNFQQLSREAHPNKRSQ